MTEFRVQTEEETTPRDPVPVELFGSDHWSTFAYIETRCVDHKGIPGIEQMRCDVKRHPGLSGRNSRIMESAGMTANKYPTRLNNGVNIHDHDDWDCADDLEAAGLLEWKGTGMHPVFVLTDLGKNVAGQLRAFKTEGGNWRSFVPVLPESKTTTVTP